MNQTCVSTDKIKEIDGKLQVVKITRKIAQYEHLYLHWRIAGVIFIDQF